MSFKNRYSFVLLLIFSLALVSCSTIRKFPDKTFITKSKLTVDNSELDYYDLNKLIRQHPNRKFLFFRIHTGIYNLGASMKDRSAIKENKIRKKIRKKIQKKQKRNPDKYIDEQKELAKSKRGTRNFLMNTIGEDPIFLDSNLTKQSIKQMELYCKKNGFFNPNIRDSVHFYSKNRKAKIYYNIIAGTPYIINKIDFVSNDPSLTSLINSKKPNSFLKVGDIYDEDNLESERTRVNDDLKNNGYYAFSKSYIKYEIDSALSNHSLNIKLIINRAYTTISDSTRFVNHEQYKINKIFVLPNFSVIGEKKLSYDTTIYLKKYKHNNPDTLYFLPQSKMRVRPKVIARKIFIKPDELFRLNHANRTQVELSNLNIFKYINIRFETDTFYADGFRYLNVFLDLSQSNAQSINMEMEATNSSGNLGTAANLVYRNRNLFKGAELFNYKFKGGLELQHSVFQSNEDIINGLPFNSAEIATEASLATPINNLWFVQGSRPMMNYSVGFNYQLRPNYERYISHARAALEWRESALGIVQIYKQINLVRILPDSLFSARISQFSKAIRYSYEDHFIPGFGFVYTKSNQPIRKNKSYFYERFAFEQAGVMFWAGNSFNSAKKGQIYRVFGINYSQYLKLDIDLRFYKPWQNKSTFVLRMFYGIGFPYGNSVLLPFEKSYSASGSNDIRAWKFRSLGPGGYSDESFFDRTGDISIVYNAEYRFPIVSLIHGAFFVDAGNVWLKNKSNEFHDGEFKFNTFYKQIAIGAGFGIRLDFSFFVFRVDAAFPLRNPSNTTNDKWIGFERFTKRTNLNFGIGYPF